MSLTKESTTYKPFLYPDFVNRAVAHERIHWHEAEADLREDVRQWKGGELTPKEKYHITSILRLFTASDFIVGNSYEDYFIPYFKNNEVRMMLTSFANREQTHQRAYALLNDTLGLDEEEYVKFLEIPELKAKADFMIGGFGDDSLSEMGISIAQTVCNEGVSLFSSFAMLLNYQRFGKMKGMCEIVEWSLREENLHCDGMVALFRQFCAEHPRIVNDDFKRTIYLMFTKAVELEDAVIDVAYRDGAPEGLPRKDIKEFIRYMADKRLIDLGLKPIFNIDNNPLAWYDSIVSGDSLKNFFEGRVTDYQIGGMVGGWGWETEAEKAA